MSEPSLASVAAKLGSALLDAAWAQWRTLGMGVAGTKQCRSIIDPEALVFASLWLSDTEPRLARVLRMWAADGSRLLSVQRTRNLSPDYSASVNAKLGGFARHAVDKGKDLRWKPLAQGREPAVREAWKVEQASPVLAAPGSLLLRLRVGMGVGIKPDVLAYLLGSAGARRSISAIADATHYYTRAVRRTVEEMVAGRFIDAAATAPASYHVRLEPWAMVLHLPDASPVWVYWHELFALGAALADAASNAGRESRYLQSSRARDVMERHRLAFDLNGVPLAPAVDHPGEEYLVALQSDVVELARRITNNFL